MSDDVKRNLISLKAALRKGGFGRTKCYELVADDTIIAYTQGGQTMVDANTIDKYHASLPRVVVSSSAKKTAPDAAS